MQDINIGKNDNECYRQFCLGRHRAFEQAQIPDQAYPAASALGHQDKNLLIYLVCHKQPGKHFENPQQQSAYNYPKVYGPKSPSFARATLSYECNSLFISGTASITGHQTLHKNNVSKQLELTLENINHLIQHIAEKEQLNLQTSFYKIYIRYPKDYALIKQQLSSSMQNTHCIFLQADICRTDLLLEIEAIYNIHD